MPGRVKQDNEAGNRVLEIPCSWMCGICSAVCRDDAAALDADTVRIDPDRCSRCLVCVRLCPAGILKDGTFEGL